MLLDLDIRDLAIFEKVHADVPGGFVSLTGETGAGKSVFLSALDLLRGQRGDASLVRQGADKAVVSARFKISGDDATLTALLEELGAEAEDGELLISREIQATGRSRARAVVRLLTDSELHDSMARAARTRAEEYSPDQAIAREWEFFRDMHDCHRKCS